MIRALATIICLALLADAAEARRRFTIVRAKPRHSTVIEQPQPDPVTRQVRIIPIVRWPLWCERIGGNECPTP